ncbi:hypothetical protein, partial [Wolbachia endosymbiont of Tettigetta isshikii]|uniref:hypothetical protein n=1 Tax=Wolbachia endosymbiont of Tettigetta isshikii TaxID=3239093 RepID=UPI0039805409
MEELILIIIINITITLTIVSVLIYYYYYSSYKNKFYNIRYKLMKGYWKNSINIDTNFNYTLYKTMIARLIRITWHKNKL